VISVQDIAVKEKSQDNKDCYNTTNKEAAGLQSVGWIVKSIVGMCEWIELLIEEINISETMMCAQCALVFHKLMHKLKMSKKIDLLPYRAPFSFLTKFQILLYNYYIIFPNKIINRNYPLSRLI